MESAASYGTDGSSADAAGAGTTASASLSASASAIANAGEWEQAYDEAGNLYYYHSVTGETSWERPQEDSLGGLDTGVSDESATIDPAYTDQNWSEPGDNSQYGSQEGYYNDSSAYSSETGAWGAEGTLAEDGWQAIDDGYGNVYYYNHYTGESQWTEPESLAALHANDYIGGLPQLQKSPEAVREMSESERAEKAATSIQRRVRGASARKKTRRAHDLLEKLSGPRSQLMRASSDGQQQEYRLPFGKSRQRPPCFI